MTDFELEIGSASRAGPGREHNEDSCGTVLEDRARAIAAVADGVSSAPGGEVASGMAIEVLLRACAEEPASLEVGQRLYRAVQQANIEIHDRAMVVPELHGMSTTLTAAAVDRGVLTAVHVGDSRLYLVRDGAIEQLTKDHTVAAEKVRYGLMSVERARSHEDRSKLLRSMGRELIVSRDRITRRLRQGDVVLLCSDGLHGALDDRELARLVTDGHADGACRDLVAAAGSAGTQDDATAAIVRVVGPTPGETAPGGLGASLRRLLRRRPDG